jgi:hypothetical protein
MVNKGKKHESVSGDSENIALVISLFFSFLGYIVNIRPKIGEYVCGFCDCFVFITILFLIILKVRNRLG